MCVELVVVHVYGDQSLLQEKRKAQRLEVAITRMISVRVMRTQIVCGVSAVSHIMTGTFLASLGGYERVAAANQVSF